MKLFANRKFQHKVGISFALMIVLIAINAGVAIIAAMTVANQLERQQKIEHVIRQVERTRLTVSHYINRQDRKLADQIFSLINSTDQQLKQFPSSLQAHNLQLLISQLSDFRIEFQKYVVQADQKSALKSVSANIGNNLQNQLEQETGALEGADQAILDDVIYHILRIQGYILKLQLLGYSIHNIGFLKAELEQMKALFSNTQGLGLQRLMFRILRDTREYISSFEAQLKYDQISRSTEARLFEISANIQTDGDRIDQAVDQEIRHHIIVSALITAFVFIVTLFTAPLLARYLSREIIKPLHQLADLTQKIAAGQLDIQAAPNSIDDDIGELYRNFNAMTLSLKHSQHQLLKKNHALQEAHVALEHRVELRTHELALSNASLQSEIDSRKRSEREIRTSEEKFRVMFELSPLGMARCKLDGSLLEANHAMQDMFGLNPNQLREYRLMDLYHHEPDKYWNTLLSHLDRAGQYSAKEIQMVGKEKTEITVRHNSVLVSDSVGKKTIWSIFEDISEQKRSEEVIWQHANFDELTGLPNRRMFQSSLDHEIKNSNRNHSRLCLMFLDLDKFKEVNDSLGHDTGDELLVQAAKRITQCVRESDIVARLGGDEFTIILPGQDKNHNLETVANKIIKSVAEPFYLNDGALYIGTSIGITFYPDDASTIEHLMSNADQAMYQAKADGRGRYCYFTRSLQAESQKKLRLIRDLRGAIKHQQLQLYYQPIVELNRGEIIKAEALLRWQHPDLGYVSPSEFIPLAEESGLILDIGSWVFKQAAIQAQQWCSQYNNDLQVSVNKSPAQFHANQAEKDDWVGHLAELGLGSHAIVIEITESLLLEASDNIKQQLLDYRDTGIQVSMDDFGTGYSSLAYLNRFHIDYLKIDQAFIKNLAPGSSEQALCEAMTVMAHKLGIRVIAEGVETLTQQELLIAAGCDYAQGYLYSKPVPSHEFEGLLEQSKTTGLKTISS